MHNIGRNKKRGSGEWQEHFTLNIRSAAESCDIQGVPNWQTNDTGTIHLT